MNDLHGLVYGGLGGVHGDVYSVTTQPDVHGIVYGGVGGVHGSVYVDEGAPTFQVAWAVGSNVVIQATVF